MYAQDRMISTVPFASNTGHRRVFSGPSNPPGIPDQPNSSKLPPSVLATFCVPLNTNIPAKYVDKSLLLERLGSLVQELQLSSACRSTCQSHVLTYANTSVKRLCRMLDFILSFGLKRPSSSYWPLAKEFSCKGQVEVILQTWKQKSNRSRALSWLYQSLNDGVLEFQMQVFSRNINGVRKFYCKNAYVWEMETLETMAIYLRSLESVSFRLFSLEQAKSMDLSDSSLGNIINECCAEHERVLSSASSLVPRPSTGPISSTSAAVVKVSPSRRTLRQPRLSASSSCDVTEIVHLFELPVADFSECPHVLGLTPEKQDLMLLDTEVCDDAMEFNFPPLNLGGIRASNVFMRRKQKHASPRPSPLATAGAVVRKIVDNQQPNLEQEQCSSLGSSFDGGSISYQRRRSRVEQDAPLSNVAADPDTMLNEILARQRVIQADVTSPVRTATPITGHNSTINDNNSTEINALKYESGLQTVQRTEPDGSDGKRGSIEIPSTACHRLRHTSSQTQLENVSIPTVHNGLVGNGDQTCVHTASSLPDRFLLPKPQPKRDGEPAPALASDFEKQLRRRLQVVSDLVATYSDSVSEHSVDSGRARSTVEDGKSSNVAMPPTVVNGQQEAESGTPVGSEVLLESGEIVDLTVRIFTNDGEQFLKMYRIYINHHFGNASIRYLMLTSYAVYVLKSSSDKNTDDTWNPTQHSPKFVVETVVPYSIIDYISVGPCHQLFYIFTIQKKQPTAVVCTCSESLTDAILSKVEFEIHRLCSGWNEDKSSCSGNGRLSGSGVVAYATPQMVALKKWLCGESGKDDLDIASYNLLYWNPNATKLDHQCDGLCGDERMGVPGRSGYLYVREVFPSSWFRKNSEWKQCYFMLRGKKIYQFEDSTCKVGQRVFDLKDEVRECRETQTNEYVYSMEMLFHHDDAVRVHLACQTKHELQQWMYAMAASFSQADVAEVDCECVSCFGVVAGKHLVLGQESSNLGFIRTLAVVRLDDVTACCWCHKHSNALLEFSSKTEYTQQRWLLGFPSEIELKRFLKAAGDNESGFHMSQLAVSCDQDTPVCAESYRHWSESSLCA